MLLSQFAMLYVKNSEFLIVKLLLVILQGEICKAVICLEIAATRYQINVFIKFAFLVLLRLLVADTEFLISGLEPYVFLY